MNLPSFPKMSELKTIVRLDNFRLVAKVLDSHLDKLDSGMRRLLSERKNEPFPTSLVNHGVLVKLIWHCACITMLRNIFDVHLPLDAQLSRRVIGFWHIGFLLAFSWFEEPHFPQNPKERAGVSVISLVSFELVENLYESGVWVSSDTVLYPCHFLLCMSLWMRCQRTMGFVFQRFLSAIESLIPAHEGGF